MVIGLCELERTFTYFFLCLDFMQIDNEACLKVCQLSLVV